jgi:hypothetical protein
MRPDEFVEIARRLCPAAAKAHAAPLATWFAQGGWFLSKRSDAPGESCSSLPAGECVCDHGTDREDSAKIGR